MGLPKFLVRNTGDGGFAYEEVLDTTRYVVLILHSFASQGSAMQVFLTRRFSTPLTLEWYAKSSVKMLNLDNWLLGLEDSAGLINAIGFVNRVTTNTIRCDNCKDGVHTYTDVALDPTVVRKYKVIWEATQIRYYIDDVLRATHTTNIPTVPLVPFSEQFNNTGGALSAIYPLYVFGGYL